LPHEDGGGIVACRRFQLFYSSESSSEAVACEQFFVKLGGSSTQISSKNCSASFEFNVEGRLSHRKIAACSGEI
jgi:hypothetical protein